MKTIKQKFSALLLSFLVTAAAVMSAVPAYAAGASISLVANKATVSNGGSLIIAVYMNGGGSPINGIEADLSYPASKLQYVGVNYSGSAFEISASGGGGDGAVSLDRGTTGSVSGAGLVATLTFRALVSSGSASISVGGNSALVTDGNAVPFAPGGVSVNFGDAVASSAASGPSAPAPAPPKDTTAPVISKLKVKTLTPYSAIIDWATDEPADSAIDYGLDANYGLSAAPAGLTTTHEVSLASSFLTPKALLHYRVKSADSSGNVQTGTDQVLQLPGVPVAIVVRGEDGQPQPDAIVTLDNQTTTTDARGQANLSSSLGSKQVVITYGGVTVRRPITVARTTKRLPPYKLDLAKQPLNHWMVTSIGLIVVVLTLLGIDVMLFGSTFMLKLIRWRQTSVPRLAGGPERLTHDTGAALFTTLAKDSPAKPDVSKPTPPPVPTPAITLHRTDLMSDMLTAPVTVDSLPEFTAPPIDPVKPVVPVMPVPDPTTAPIPTPAPEPAGIAITVSHHASETPAASVAKRLKTRAKTTVHPKTAKSKTTPKP